MNVAEKTNFEKIFKKAPRLEGYSYSIAEALKARNNKNILSIRLETSLRCNARCIYCCNRSGKALTNELSYDKLIELILEAKALKARSVVVIGGGEPTIYPQFRDLISFIFQNNLIPVIFTNTQTITKDLASFLFNNNVSVITKLDSLNEEIQDKMIGIKDGSKKIMEGLNYLIEAGYTKNLKNSSIYKLGASFVVNRINATTIPDVWRFCRDNNIFPNLEMMVPNEKGKEMNDYLLSREECKTLKLNLLEIDRNEYGFNWLPYTPIPASGCFQVLYNMYITVRGIVRPCSSIHFDGPTVHNYSLKEILDTQYFQAARNCEKNLKGKCKKCEYLKECIGCRGISFAYAKNNGVDYFEALVSEDPTCFK